MVRIKVLPNTLISNKSLSPVIKWVAFPSWDKESKKQY